MEGSSHTHGYSRDTHRGPLAIALAITAGIFVIQVIGAVWTGSLALLFDSAHVLTDAGGLAMALVAASLSTRAATAKRTWGFRRAEVLAATVQAAILLAAGIYVLIEGIQRLITPTEVASEEMIIFGIIGLVGNIAAILVLTSRRSANFNLRGAFLEVVNDAPGSVAVIVAAIIITATGWARADAIVAMLIGLLILSRTIKLLRETIHVLLEATPRGRDLDNVREHILAVPHVHAVHDLHATQVATGLPVLTAQTSWSTMNASSTVIPLRCSTACRNASPRTSTSVLNTPPSNSNHPPTRTMNTGSSTNPLSTPGLPAGRPRVTLC